MTRERACKALSMGESPREAQGASKGNRWAEPTYLLEFIWEVSGLRPPISIKIHQIEKDGHNLGLKTVI